MSRTFRAGWIAAAGTGVLVVLYGLPFLWLVATSLKTDAQIFATGGGLIFQPTFENYQSVVNQQLIQACVNSAIIATGTTALTLTLATPA
jgi:multiple sugar transport system permease protein